MNRPEQQAQWHRVSRWLWLVGLAVGLAAGTAVALEIAGAAQRSTIAAGGD